MNEIASISGAIIVAIITLTGTYFINEFTKNLEYKTFIIYKSSIGD